MVCDSVNSVDMVIGLLSEMQAALLRLNEPKLEDFAAAVDQLKSGFVLNKFQLSVLIVALSAPIFGVRLENKVPHLVGIFKNEQRGAMRHGPNANCTNFYSILTKSKTTCSPKTERTSGGPWTYTNTTIL